MTTTPPDSGTQPSPHYCTHPRGDLGSRAGCPRWPACVALDGPPRLRLVSTDADVAAERRLHAALAAAKAGDTDDDQPGLAVALATLAGGIAWIIIAAVVAAILLPLLF